MGISASPALREHPDKIERILTAFWMRAFLLFGKRLLDSLAPKSASPDEQKDAVSDVTARAQRWIGQNGTRKIVQIADTTRRDINRAIAAGIEAGEGQRVIAKRIRARTGGLIGKRRSNIIARTEVHGASVAAGQAAVDAAGIANQIIRQWIAAQDERTRETHRAADGQQRTQTEPFNVGGAILMFPGDPNGPPEEVINCRCVVLYVPIDDAGVGEPPTTPTPAPNVPTRPGRLPARPRPPPEPVQPIGQVSWEPVETVTAGKRQIKQKFGTQYFESRKTKLDFKKFWGEATTEAETVTLMNGYGRELTRLANKGIELGQSVKLMDRTLVGTNANGMARVLDKRQKFLAVGQPERLQKSGINGAKYRNAYDRPWTTWAYDQTETKFAHTLRHEMGHSWTTLAVQNDMGRALLELGKPMRKLINPETQVAYTPAKAGAEWARANLGEYAASAVDETIAESFAMFTGPNYIKGTLPASIEKIMEQIIKGANTSRRRAASAAAKRRTARR